MCFSSSLFYLRDFYLSFILYVLLSSFLLCLSGWLASGGYLSFTFFFSLFLFCPLKPRFLLLILSACQPHLSLYCLATGFLLSQSGALGRQGETNAAHLCIVEAIFHNREDVMWEGIKTFAFFNTLTFRFLSQKLHLSKYSLKKYIWSENSH